MNACSGALRKAFDLNRFLRLFPASRHQLLITAGRLQHPGVKYVHFATRAFTFRFQASAFKTAATNPD
jgi:hypothetical protein